MNSTKEIIEHFQLKNIEKSDITDMVNIQLPTLKKYEKEEQTLESNRPSKERFKLFALFGIDKEFESRGYLDFKENISKIKIDGQGVLSYLNDYMGTDINSFQALTKAIKEVIRSRIPEVELNDIPVTESKLEKFETKFGLTTDENLLIAAKEDPGIIIDLIHDDSIKAIGRAEMLKILGKTLNENLYGSIKDFTTSQWSPFIRIAAFESLLAYFINQPDKHEELDDYFYQAIKNEDKVGLKSVANTLRGLYDYMD